LPRIAALHDRSQAAELDWRSHLRQDPLDDELRQDGIEMIAPHRCNRSKPPTQDRRRLSRYMRRWLVERFFAWIQWQRRILVRWEFYAQNFLGFVQLALPPRSLQAILR
jgi:transposase